MVPLSPWPQGTTTRYVSTHLLEEIGNTRLVHRGHCKKLAIEVRGQDDTPGGLWVLRSDDIRETLDPIRRSVVEGILFDVPAEFLHRVDDVPPNHGVVVRIRWSGHEYAR